MLVFRTFPQVLSADGGSLEASGAGRPGGRPLETVSTQTADLLQMNVFCVGKGLKSGFT